MPQNGLPLNGLQVRILHITTLGKSSGLHTLKQLHDKLTKHIIQKWLLHEQVLRNPPTDRMRAVHMLHQTQSVPMLDENSALRGNMPQRNDEEGGKQPRLAFSHAASLWGQMGRAWTTDGCNAPRTTGPMTEKDYVAFFHQFFGLTNTLPSLLCECAMPLQAVLHGC
jgi:hypothetical protein